MTRVRVCRLLIAIAGMLTGMFAGTLIFFAASAIAHALFGIWMP